MVVTNLSAEPLTIRSLTDDIYGNIATQGTCTTAVGTVLAASPGPGNTYSCSFTGNFNGDAGDSQTDTVTVTGEDDDGNTATDTDDAIVTLTDVLPIIAVDKTATPASLPEPGGQFTFNVVVTNLSSEPLTITSLTDDIYGNIATQGTCTTAVGTVLAASPGPGNTYSCSFTGNFNGNARRQPDRHRHRHRRGRRRQRRHRHRRRGRHPHRRPADHRGRQDGHPGLAARARRPVHVQRGGHQPEQPSR